MDYEALIKRLTCKFGRNSSHLLYNPKILPCCNSTLCDQCIRKACGQHDNCFTCSICNESNKIRFKDDECLLESNKSVQKDLDKYTIDINHYLLRKLDCSINRVEGRNFHNNSNYNIILKNRFFLLMECKFQKLFIFSF